MKQVYLGYSALYFDEVKSLIDSGYISPEEEQAVYEKIFEGEEVNSSKEHAEPCSYIQRQFGASYILPENYEIHDRQSYYRNKEDFSPYVIKESLPFNALGLKLWEEDFSKINSIFFIVDNANWHIKPDKNISITDVIEVNSLDFE